MLESSSWRRRARSLRIFLACAGHTFTHSPQATQASGMTLAIWMGYTFLTPATSIAGGFYSIWHNVYNSWQLYKENRAHK